MITCIVAAMMMTRGEPFSSIVSVPLDPKASMGSAQFFTSENIVPGLEWDEAIVSWNVENSTNAKLTVQIQPTSGPNDTKWYTLAEWTGDMARGDRHSVPDQADENAEILTDVLRLKTRSEGVRVRVRLDQFEQSSIPKLKLLTVAFSNSKRIAKSNMASQVVEPLGVPELAQGPYEYGKLAFKPEQASNEFKKWFAGVKDPQYCSPTSTTMVLRYWSMALNRPDLALDVPDAVLATFDSKYPGTGNWPFNTAYLGSFAGMRSYVSRLETIEDAAQVVKHGIPLVCSVSHNLLRGTGKPGGDGHLVVLIGFRDGKAIFNDPGKTGEVHREYTLENFERAWSHARRTVYVCHPTGMKLPQVRGILP